MDRSSAASSDATRRAAYLASARRRRPPPSFRPWMIIVIVLAVGLTLIGLTMTIIGVWPGYSAVGGNPLKIVGPIMLGVGVIALVVAIFNICYRGNEEKKARWRSFQDMRSNASTATSRHSGRRTPTTPPMNARPTKSILKTPSTSTYNGTRNSMGEYESDSGMHNTHSFSTNRSYERESDASDNSARMDHIKVDMMPDPTQAYRHGKPVDQSSTGSDQGVPPASMSAPRYGNQRPTSGKPSSRSKPTYSNQAYTADAKETDIDGDLAMQDPRPRRTMQQYSSEGYDAFDQSAVSGQVNIAGGGALGSPYGTPQGQQPPRTRWGSKSPRSPTGHSNQAYTTEQQQVSVVSDVYQQATTPYSTPSGGQLHYTSYAHSEGRGQAQQPTTPSSSTEV